MARIRVRGVRHQRVLASDRWLARVDRYTERLAEAGIEPSVGSTGESYDNALAETVIGLFKAEEIYRRGPWKGLEAVESASLEWVAWYNGNTACTRRLAICRRPSSSRPIMTVRRHRLT